MGFGQKVYIYKCIIQTFSSDDLSYPVEEAPVLWVGRRLVMDEFYLPADHMLSFKLIWHCGNIIRNKSNDMDTVIYGILRPNQHLRQDYTHATHSIVTITFKTTHFQTTKA